MGCLDDDWERSKIEGCRGSSVSGDSISTKSCASLITTSDISTDEIRARKIRIMALAALRHQRKDLRRPPYILIFFRFMFKYQFFCWFIFLDFGILIGYLCRWRIDKVVAIIIF
ncbi:uncharacterized protein LOC125475774 isoform X2 [Pyrus x bretschneideri]|uniref:uncharacterized protein LOC125475774 isoform X2 n=1 Tax=Pyrus x bretschneideri TaxID=225117 RepID=UPI00202FF39E|nr:uncharacterized protein LOC125475774 isoform X2 [Pyrus x bretschneideri]